MDMDANPHGDAYPHFHANGDAYPHGYAYLDGDQRSDQHANQHGDTDMDTGRAYCYTDRNTYPHAYQDADSDGHTDRNQDTHSDANGHAYRHTAHGYPAAIPVHRLSRSYLGRCIHQ